MKTEKLIYVSCWYVDSPDGVGQKIRGQIQALSEHFNVSFFGPKFNKTIFWRILSLLKTQFALILKIKKDDVVYYRYGPQLFFFNLFLFFFKPKRLFIEINSSTNELRLNGFYISYLLALISDKVVLPRATKLITFSNELASSLSQKYGDQEIVVINNAYYFEPSNKPPNADLVVLLEEVKSRNSTLAIMVSSLKPWHGLDIIFELVKQLPDVELCVVGDGELRDDLQKLANSLQIHSRVHFVGYRESGDLEFLYKSSAFSFASFAPLRASLTELSPLKVAEYLHFGLPVVINFKNSLLADQQFVHVWGDGSVENLRDFIASISMFDEGAIKKFAQKHYSWSSNLSTALGLE